MKTFLLSTVSIFIVFQTYSQGCVAIRSNGSSCNLENPSHSISKGWSLGINYRYFRSFRHFVEKEEQKQRVEGGTEVVNYSNSAELSLTRVVNNRWSYNINLPVIANTRSSLYEHTGKNRYSTQSFGIGDAKLAAYYWITNPALMKKLNMQVGLGIKLPTGDYRYQDNFHNTDSTTVLGPVDQSIQLGDGGTGFTLETNVFFQAARSFTIYANGFYLLNPREHNGVSTSRGRTPSASAIAYGSDVMSVPDQYMMRVGAMYSIKKLSISGGLRMEGIPSEDIVGGSNGFRRPGYVLSAEPVVAYKLNKVHMYVSVPFAIERSRTQSYPDKIRSQKTGARFVGDAAFADYSVNLGATVALSH